MSGTVGRDCLPRRTGGPVPPGAREAHRACPPQEAWARLWASPGVGPTWRLGGRLGCWRGPEQPSDDAASGRCGWWGRGLSWGRGCWGRLRSWLGRARAGAPRGHCAQRHHRGLGAGGRALSVGGQWGCVATTARLHHLQEAAGNGRCECRLPCAGKRPSPREVPGAAVLMATGSPPRGPGHHLPLAEDAAARKPEQGLPLGGWAFKQKAGAQSRRPRL